MNEQDSAASAVRRINEKKRLDQFVLFQNLFPDEHGVLLSEKIERYCKADCKLIWPYEPSKLRPAGYDLRVGENYVIRGEKRPLSEGNHFDIDPYTVVVVQTLETVNLPPFLIGRWNILVTLAYKGLLWVGGAQVDPGFAGKLSCPVYNLSNEKVRLSYGDSLAMIDFVTTTNPAPGKSKPFDRRGRKKILVEDYAGTLTSGVEERLNRTDSRLNSELEKVNRTVNDAAKETNRRADKVDARIDNFVSLVFTVVAVLFAGLGIVATKSAGRISIAATPVALAGIAFYLALRAFERAVVPADQASTTESATVLQIVKRNQREILVCVGFAALLLAFSGYEWFVAGYHVRQTEREYRAKAREYELRSRDLDAYKRELSGKVDSLERTLKSYEMDHSHTASVKGRK